MNKKEVVKKRYSEIAQSGCSCCDNTNNLCHQDTALKLGYSDRDLKTIPEGSNLGLGCGSPVTVAEIKQGETILDLGSGAGLDCFIAAKETGPTGRVIGVDMTKEMIDKAQNNLHNTTYNNIEFRQGDIENLPVEDNFIDVVISNCVINLCENKQKVYDEIFRVLEPGGRVAISDVITLKPIPQELLECPDALCSCISGAITIENTRKILENSGFSEITIEPKDNSHEFIKDWSDALKLEDYIIAVYIKAKK